MANCHDLFQQFHQDELSITGGKKDRMADSKDALRRRIRKWFKENHPDYEPKFFIHIISSIKLYYYEKGSPSPLLDMHSAFLLQCAKPRGDALPGRGPRRQWHPDS